MPLLKSNDFWKPKTYYYNTERYKSLIEKDNTLYICNESHLSQDEFDATKFNVVGGSGGSGGGGFSFGGNWNAIASEDIHLAAFDYFDNCTLTSSTILSAIDAGIPFTATIHNLSHSANTGTGHLFRVTVPDTSSGVFGVFIHNSNLNFNPYAPDLNATIRGFFSTSGSGMSITQNAAASSTYPVTVSTGDILRVVYRSDMSAVYIYNETAGGATLLFSQYISGFASSVVHLTVYAQGVGDTLSFDLYDEFYPLYQSKFIFDYPDDLTKTYHVSAANANSTINDKLLKVNDFVNFITQGDDVVDIVISRLMTDAQIKTLTDTAIYDYLDNEQSDVDSNLSLYIKNLIQTELQDTNSSIYQAATYLTQAVITTETQGGGIIDNLMLSTLNDVGLTDGMDNIVHVQDVIGQECQSGGIIDIAIQSAVNP